MQKQVHQTGFGNWKQLAGRFKTLPGPKALAAGLLLAGSLFATTAQAQTTLLTEGFETGGTGWTIVNGTQVNQWVVGTATAASGTQSAYISNDAGVTNAYTITTASTTHIYQDITFPAGQTDFQLTFKWKAQGDGTTDLDNLKVFASATSATVTAGTAMPAADRIGAAWYNLSGSYTTTTINLPSNFAGTTKRIVFSWKNNTTVGTQPPASIDDITITYRPAVPISGVYTINNTLPTGGTNFASFTDAFNKLNTEGISGPLTLNVSAGQTFTELPPALIATGTAANPIVVQKSGSGANPLIVAAPGVSTSTDGIIVIAGTDYITFDGIDVQDPATNTTTTTQMEWGYAVLKATNTNGSQFVTIKNAAITLQKIRTASIGIYSASHTPASTTNLSTTGATTDGANSNNQFFSNTISNVNTGIRLEGSSLAGMYDVNNQVGVSGANTITNFGGTSTASYAIYSIYQDTYKIANNSITGGTGSTSTQYGIFMSTANNANIDIYNNNVNITTSSTSSEAHGINNAGGGSGTNNLVKIYGNTIQITTAGASSSGSIYGLYNTATAFNIDIYNNTIASINRVGTGTTYGIYQSASVVNKANIYNNTIKDLSSTGSSTMYALYTSSAATTDIYGNTINNITTTNATVNGMYLASGNLVNVFNNQIFNLTSTSTSAVIFGIQNWNAPTANIYNNFISDLKTPVATSADAVRGIYINGGTYNGIFYNTIYLNASSSSTTTFGTSAILVNTSYPVEMRNNIIVNNSVPGPTGGLTVAYRRSSTTLTNYAATSDNNIFYAGTPSANRVIFYDGTNADQTLGAYKARVSPRDANSTSELPPFVNITTAPYNLHLQTTVATSAESGATPVTSPIAITTDFDGNPRNTTTPDIGADEGTFIPRDLVAPSITYNPVGNTSSTANRTFTATISDDSGIPTTGSLVPRVYFRKGTSGAFVSQAGTLTAGTGLNGTWSFTIDYSMVGGIAAGDVIDYYLIAQDVNGNVNSAPAGAIATDVNNVTSVSLIYRYNVAAPIAASITVPGTYPSLTNAGGLFEAINKSVLTGNVNVQITGDLTAETGANGLNQFTEEGAGNYTLTIRPDAATNRIISGSVATAGLGLIRMIGADRVTIDGSFNGTGNYLTIINTATGSTPVALQAVAGAVNNTYRNLNISTGTNTVAGYGIVTNGANNSNLLLENNTITKAYYGISAQNDAASPGTNLIIRNNTIGSATAADYVTFRGIVVTNATAPEISGNTVFNIKLAASVNNAGIDLGANVSNALVSKNTVRGVYNTSTSGYGAWGISISSGTGSSNNQIVNNMISDIVTDGDGADDTMFNPFGIRISGGTNHKVYYNSVNLSGALTGNSADMTAAFIISEASTNLDVRNNIFANSMTGGANTESFAVYAVSGTTFATINYNNYFVAGTAGKIGYLTADKATLADWKAATTQDVNSVSVDPMFSSATDLHVASSNLAMNNLGTPIAGITTDFDGDARHASTPDMGADEYTPAALDLGATALVSPIVKSCYSNAEQVTITIQNLGLSAVDFATTNATVTVNISLGGVPQTPLVVTLNNNSLNGGNPLAAGATLNVPIGTVNMLTAGTYLFNASTAVTTGGIDGNTSNNDMTAVSIVVNPLTAGTATATKTSLCQSGTTTLNLTGNAGGDIQWQQAASATGPFTNVTGATSTTFTPAAPLTATTYFQAIISCGLNADTTNLVTVTVNTPAITASAGDTRCGAGTVTLSATPSAGYTINWYTSAAGGVPVATGTTYSPNVTATTTYYATATTGGGTFNVGATTNTIGAGSGSNVGHYQIFNVLANATLEGVHVYPTAAGNVILVLQNSATTVLQTVTVPVTAANVNQKTFIPLNWSLTPGTGYRIGTTSASVNLYRNSAGAVYPYTIPGVLSITGNTFDPVYYYYAYDWVVSTGCESARTAVVATVNTAPTVNLGTDVTQCGTTPVVLDAGNAGATYQWSLNGTAISGATSQTLSATASGTYSVTVTANGCAGSDDVVVSMGNAPADATIAAGGATTFCSGGSVTLTASSTTTGATFQWSLNGTAITGATSATYTANAAGSYTVVASANGCSSAASAATTVTVNSAPATPTITAGGATTFCTGGSVALTAASTTTGATFQWFNNGTAISGATAASFTANASGSYTVVASANGCSSAASTATTVTVNATPATPTITVAAGGSTTICQGSSVSLTGASATAGVTYRWSLNGAPIAGATSATFVATLAGNYRVIATNGGCSDSSAVTAVTVNPKPTTPVITKTGNMLSVPTTTGATYQWYSVSGSALTAVSGATAATFTPTVNGDYTVKITVNGCESDAATTMNVVLGIASLAPGMDVSVYPNPTAGKFEVKLTGFEKEAMVQIISVTGQVIASERVAITSDKTSKAFDLGGMAKGVYILKVTSGNNLTFRKVILD